MLESFVSLWLIASPTVAAAPAEAGPAQEADLSEAKRLYNEGTVRYEAADFAGAIESFTLALSELRSEGINDFSIRGLLLFNIGRTHMRAYEIDGEVEHLLQARTIFTSFVEEAHGHPDQVAPGDIEEAKTRLEEIEGLLASRDDPASEGDAIQPSTDTPADSGVDQADERDPKRLRASGIGLSVAGAALIGGGVGMIAWGAGFAPAARAQVAELDTLDLPPDSPAYADGEAHIATERRKGTAWMAAGGVAAALGVAGLAVGIRQLVVAKRVRERRVSAVGSFGPEMVWLGVTGRF